MLGALLVLLNNAQGAAYTIETGVSVTKWAKRTIDDLRGQHPPESHVFKGSSVVVDDLNDGRDSEDKRWTRDKFVLFVCAFIRLDDRSDDIIWTRPVEMIFTFLTRDRKIPLTPESRDRLVSEIRGVGDSVKTLKLNFGPISAPPEPAQRKPYVNPLQEWKKGFILRIPAYSIDGIHAAKSAYRHVKYAYQTGRAKIATVEQIRSAFKLLEDCGLSSLEAQEVLIDQGFSLTDIAAAVG